MTPPATPSKPVVALVIPVHQEVTGEGDQRINWCERTVRAHKGHVDHVYLIDDRCVDASIRETLAIHPTCRTLTLPDRRVADDLPIGGPGQGRRVGVLQALADGADVVIVSDAHTLPRVGDMRQLAMQAAELDGVLQAGTSPFYGDSLDQPDAPRWCRAGHWPQWHDSSCSTIKDGLQDLGQPDDDAHWQTLPALVDAGYLYGSVYAATRDVWGMINHVPPTLSWGYNEPALTLACLSQGVPMYASRACVLWHRFKSPDAVSTRSDRLERGVWLNRYLAHWYISDDDEWPGVLAGLRDRFHIEDDAMQAVLAAMPEATETRRAFLRGRRRDWSEIRELIRAHESLLGVQ